MVVNIDVLDILMAETGMDPKIYIPIPTTAYSNTYKDVYRDLLITPFVSESSVREERLEELFNRRHNIDGVSIKHTETSTINFTFISEQHCTMFMLKYS